MKELKIARYIAAIVIIVMGLFWMPENDKASEKEEKSPEIVTVVTPDRMSSPATLTDAVTSGKKEHEENKSEGAAQYAKKGAVEHKPNTRQNDTKSEAKRADQNTEEEKRQQNTEFAPAQVTESTEAQTEAVTEEQTEAPETTQEETTEQETTEAAPEETTTEMRIVEIDDVEPEPTLRFLGTFEMTAYIPTGNPCANGNWPTAGYTVAHQDLPFGTKIYIEGYGYRTVEDRGVYGNVIDLFVDTYDEAINIGRRTVNVYIVE